MSHSAHRLSERRGHPVSNASLEIPSSKTWSGSSSPADFEGGLTSPTSRNISPSGSRLSTSKYSGLRMPGSCRASALPLPSGKWAACCPGGGRGVGDAAGENHRSRRHGSALRILFRADHVPALLLHQSGTAEVLVPPAGGAPTDPVRNGHGSAGLYAGGTLPAENHRWVCGRRGVPETSGARKVPRWSRAPPTGSWSRCYRTPRT